MVVQSAAIGVIGALLKSAPSPLQLGVTILLPDSLAFSIRVWAVWVSGTVSGIAQRLPALLAQNPHVDILAERGGLTGRRHRLLGPTRGDHCMLQANSFMVSLLLFSFFEFPPLPLSLRLAHPARSGFLQGFPQRPRCL